MNKNKHEGNLNLNKQAYENFAFMFYLILEEITRERDMQDNIDYIKNIVNLSQSYFKMPDEPNRPRVYLYYSLNDLVIWNNERLWKCLIRHTIVEELQYIKSFLNANLFDNKDEKIAKTKKVAFNKITSSVYSMINFKVSKNVLKEIILDLNDIYKFNDNELKEIDKTIEEFEIKKSKILNKDNVLTETNIDSKLNEKSDLQKITDFDEIGTDGKFKNDKKEFEK